VLGNSLPGYVDLFQFVLLYRFALVEDVDGCYEIFEQFRLILLVYFWLIKYY
jgi:hypothetical protein